MPRVLRSGAEVISLSLDLEKYVGNYKLEQLPAELCDDIDSNIYGQSDLIGSVMSVFLGVTAQDLQVVQKTIIDSMKCYCGEIVASLQRIDSLSKTLSATTGCMLSQKLDLRCCSTSSSQKHGQTM